jgi:UDP-glucose 4-epimerase
MRVAITGATGNVGTSVIEILARDPRVHEIVGISRRLPRASFDKTRFVQADVAESDLLPLFADMDAVIHLAWQIQPSHRERQLERTNLLGSRRVFDATAESAVPALIYASSVGAYSAAPKGRLHDESWPTGGVKRSLYSRHKSRVERMLDHFEPKHPEVRVVRMRPALIFKRDAASGIRRLFVGGLLPRSLIGGRPRAVPDHPDFRFQAVHSLDAGRAFQAALFSEARGAFNVSADPILDSDSLARAFGAKKVRVSRATLRLAAAVSWRLRLQRSEPGWLDLCFECPLMSTERAERLLGWRPERSSIEALTELLDGISKGAGLGTPPLAPPLHGRMSTQRGAR